MTGVRERSANGWDALFVLSLVAILAAGWFAFLRPHPSAGTADPSGGLAGLTSETREIKDRASRAEQRVQARTWDASPAMFGSQILDSLNKLATASHLQLAGIRVGKPLRAASLTEVPLFVNVEGRFMDVMDMVRAIEMPDSKIAVDQLEISATSNTDHVTATLSVTGFLRQEGS